MGPRIYPSFQNTNSNTVGSLIVQFDELYTNYGLDNIEVVVNDNTRQLIWLDTEGLYSTYLYSGDTVQIYVNTLQNGLRKTVDLIRRDYTTDDINGDNGIRDTYITGATGTTSTQLLFTFVVTPPELDYNFEYRISSLTQVNPDCDISGFAGGFPIPQPTPPTSTFTLSFQYATYYGDYGTSLQQYYIETNLGNYYYYGPYLVSNFFNSVRIDRVISGYGQFLSAYHAKVFKNGVEVISIPRNINRTLNGLRTDTACPVTGGCDQYISINPNDNIVIYWLDYVLESSPF